MVGGERPTPTLLWFLKAPHPGKVKTRLAADIGEKAAVTVYRTLVDHLWEKLQPGYGHQVHYAPAGAEAEMRAWLGSNPEYFPQREGDLGVRLQSAVDKYYRQFSGKIILLGGDCPYLSRPYLQAASQALDQVDVVIGPAFDGGYVLLGLTRNLPELFQDIPWSGAKVCSLTQERARAQGRSSKLLDPLEDVDDLESWKRAQRAFSFPRIDSDAYST